MRAQRGQDVDAVGDHSACRRRWGSDGIPELDEGTLLHERVARVTIGIAFRINTRVDARDARAARRPRRPRRASRRAPRRAPRRARRPGVHGRVGLARTAAARCVAACNQCHQACHEGPGEREKAGGRRASAEGSDGHIPTSSKGRASMGAAAVRACLPHGQRDEVVPWCRAGLTPARGSATA